MADQATRPAGRSCLTASVLLLAIVPCAVAQQPTAAPGLETRLEEQRHHLTFRGPLAEETSERPLDPTGRAFPESAVILRRWKSRSGTERLQFNYLLDLGNGVRLTQVESTDYFTCRGRSQIDVTWPSGSREYLRFSESMEVCPDHTEEGFMKWATAVAEGKEKLPANHLLTVETKQVKVTMEADEWQATGNKEVLSTLGPELAQVFTDDLAPLSRADAFAAGICEKLAGLYRLKCGKGTEASAILKVGPPDCDFDGSFGEPCTAEQQRQFDARRGRSTIGPTPTPGTR